MNAHELSLPALESEFFFAYGVSRFPCPTSLACDSLRSGRSGKPKSSLSHLYTRACAVLSATEIVLTLHHVSKGTPRTLISVAKRCDDGFRPLHREARILKAKLRPRNHLTITLSNVEIQIRASDIKLYTVLSSSSLLLSPPRCHEYNS